MEKNKCNQLHLRKLDRVMPKIRIAAAKEQISIRAFVVRALARAVGLSESTDQTYRSSWKFAGKKAK